MWEHFPYIKLKIPFRDFERLPQHPAYRYEFWGGFARMDGRPKVYHATRPIVRSRPPETVERPRDGGLVRFRPLKEEDWNDLPELMLRAFREVPPFAQLRPAKALAAAEDCMGKVRAGKEGPLIPEACFVAESAVGTGRASGDEPILIGAVLLTRHTRHRTWLDQDYKSHGGEERPHLTWAMTRRWDARAGIGTALLQLAMNALDDAGDRELDSTFMAGNSGSMLWHWRNGFAVMPFILGERALRTRLDDESCE